MNRLPRPSTVAAARIVLGGIFVYLGALKALDPVAFLKLVRQFEVVQAPPGLNAIAALLPWFEIFCGALLLIGAKVRAAALVQMTLLAGFTGLVLVRSWAIYRAGDVPFCAIHFDCGCGTGEVLICMKLAENLGLMALAAWVAFRAPVDAVGK